MFSDTLDEFDDSRHVVQDLIDEYEACETPDYVNFVRRERARHQKCINSLHLCFSLRRDPRIGWKHNGLALDSCKCRKKKVDLLYI
jgi:hypothetical protein